MRNARLTTKTEGSREPRATKALKACSGNIPKLPDEGRINDHAIAFAYQTCLNFVAASISMKLRLRSESTYPNADLRPSHWSRPRCRRRSILHRLYFDTVHTCNYNSYNSIGSLSSGSCHNHTRRVLQPR